MDKTVNTVQQWVDHQYAETYDIAGLPTKGEQRIQVRADNTVTYSPYTKPNWKHLIAAGQDAGTSLYGTRNACKPGQYSAQYKGQFGAQAGFVEASDPIIRDISDPGDAPHPDAKYQASKALLGQYIAATATWRGGNFIAEFAETVNMLAHPLKSIYSRTWSLAGSAKNLGKIYAQDPVRYGKALGGAWLGYAFGIKPLVQDANDALAACHKLGDGVFGDRFKLQASGFVRTQPVITRPQLGIGVGGYGYSPNRDMVKQTTYSVRYKGAIYSSPPSIGALLENFGVGFTDLLPAVWEAIPWSFLVDYFINVQELLDSAKLAFADISFLNMTVRNSATCNTKNYAAAVHPAKFTEFSTPGWAARTRVTRTPLHSLPYPGFHYRIPGIESSKWCNVAALAAQIAGSVPLKR